MQQQRTSLPGGPMPAPQQPPLPPGWQLFVDQYGRPFYWNHFTQESSWTPPTFTPPPPLAPTPTQTSLPPGWEQAIDAEGRSYFIDHINKTTTWEDPRKKMQPAQPAQPNPTATKPPVQQTMPLNPVQNNTTNVPNQGQYPAFELFQDNTYMYPGIYRYGQSQPQQISPQNASINQQPQNFVQPQLTSTSPTALHPANYGYPATTANQSQPNFNVGSPPMNFQPQNTIPQTSALGSLCVTKPNWDTTVENPRCARCDVEFSFFKRRHHCRCCFREYCDTCTTKRAPVLAFGHRDPQRVCDCCHDHILRNENECISRLVPYLVASSPDLSKALKEFHDILGAITAKHSIYEEVVRLGVIVPLVQLLQSTTLTAETKLGVLRVFSKILTDPKVVEVLSTMGVLKIMLTMLNSDANVDIKTEICKSFANLATFSPVMKDELRTSGGLKVLLEILGGSTDEILQEHSALALSVLTTDNDENKKVVGELGAAAIVIHLSSMNPSILESVTSIVEQLSSTEVSRKYIEEIGGVAALLSLLQTAMELGKQPITPAVMANVLKSLVLLTQAKRICEVVATYQSGIGSLTNILAVSVEDPVLKYTLHTLVNVASHPEYRGMVNGVLLQGALPYVLKQLTSNNTAVQAGALELMSYISEFEDSKNAVRDSGGIALLTRIIATQNDNLMRALLALTKLAENSELTAVATVEVGGLLLLLDLITSPNAETQFLSLKCLSTLCSFPKVVAALPPGAGTTSAIALLLSSPNLDVVEQAVQILGTLCMEDVNRAGLLATGKLSELAKLLSTNNEQLQQGILRLIGSLCGSDKVDDPARDMISDIGVIPSILSLLSSTNDNVRRFATIALRESCRAYKNRESIKNFGGVSLLVDILKASAPVKLSPEARVLITEVLAAFSSDDISRQAIQDAGGLPLFIELLYTDTDQVQLNAVMILSNFALDEKYCEVIAKNGGVQSLVPLLSSDKPSVQEAVCLCVGNLARAPSSKDAMIQVDVMSPLLALLTSGDDTIKARAIWAIGMISFQADIGKQVQENPQGLSAIIDLLQSPNENVRQQVIFILMNFSSNNPNIWDFIVNTGGIKALLVLASSQNVEAQRKASAEIGALIAIPDFKKQVMESPNGVAQLVDLLSSSDKLVMESAVLAAASLSTDEQNWEKLAVALPNVISLLSSTKVEVQTAAATVMANMSTKDAHRKAIMDNNALPKIIEHEQLITQSLRMIRGLSGSETMAETMHSGGVILALITLLSHNNEAVKEDAVLILGSLARSSKVCRDALVDNNVETIVPLLSSPNNKILKQAVFVVCVLSSNAQFCKTIVTMGGLASLVTLLKTPPQELQAELQEGTATVDLEIFDQVAEILVNVSKCDNQNREAVVQAGALPPLLAHVQNSLSLLDNTTPQNVQHKLLKVLVNLSIANSNKDAIRENGGLSVIMQVLASATDDAKLEASRALGHCTLNEINRQSLLELGLIETLMPLLTVAKPKDLIITALWILDNFTTSEPARQKLQQAGFVPALITLLASQEEAVLLKATWVLRNVVFYDNQCQSFLDNQGVEILVKLLSVSVNETVLLQTVNVINSVLLFDTCRKRVEAFVDKALTDKLSKFASLQSMAAQLKETLGL